MSGWLRKVLPTALMTIAGSLAVAASLGMSPIQFGVPATGDASKLGRVPSADDDTPYPNHEMQSRQLKRLREEHQKQVFSDTNRLIQLATDLKTEVDKGNEQTLVVIKDVDEIGKLAKRVSDRIKTQ